MSGVPYTFGNATTTIALSNLDTNFATPVTIGNTSVALGNTVTTIGNLTLTNATISSTASQFNVSSMPSGSIIQTVQANYSSQISTTSTSLVTTGWTANITPQLSTSKILIQFVTNATLTATGNAQFTLYRGGSSLSVSNGMVTTATSGAIWIPIEIEYLDSPTSTSSLTYTIYFGVTSGTGTLLGNISGFGQATSITLLEIR